MFHNHTAKPHLLSHIFISALIFCWLLLPAGTPAGEESDHQMAPAQSEHQGENSMTTPCEMRPKRMSTATTKTKI